MRIWRTPTGVEGIGDTKLDDFDGVEGLICDENAGVTKVSGGVG